jgi:hypothetical protein
MATEIYCELRSGYTAGAAVYLGEYNLTEGMVVSDMAGDFTGFECEPLTR